MFINERKIEWKKLLISAAAMALLTAIALIFNVPNPNMILITGLVVFTSLYGYGAGIICGLFMIAYSMYFFSTNNNFISYTALNLQKMAVILLGVVVNFIFVGKLNKRQRDVQQELKEINDELRRDNTTLKAASLTDSLTGLRNRFALRRDYDRYSHKDLIVMLLDVDNFKAANDQYGHAVGDFILGRTGKILLDTFGGDCCYRYGGDEFLIIMPDTGLDEFTELVETSKRALKEIFLDDKKLPVYFSGGYVYGKNEMQRDLRMMINHADKHLYDAKANGKNCFLGGEFRRAFAESSNELFKS